jgi:hypothetical protein
MSQLTLRNNTPYVAQYVVRKGDQIIARIPAVEPNALLSIPTDESFEVLATTVIDGNTYTSAPQTVEGSTGFLARVLQVPAQGTYEFDVIEVPGKAPNTLEFQKTCLGAVTFTIIKNGKPLQTVVVDNDYGRRVLDIGDTFYVYAVVNGVTTATASFTSASATITVVLSNSDLERGYVDLLIT